MYSPRFILAGEYANARTNPEIVSPQSIMRETFEQASKDNNEEMIILLGQILDALQGDKTLEVDGQTLLTVMKGQMARERRRTGRTYAY